MVALVQHTQHVIQPETKWWAMVYPHAIKLERRITPDPQIVPPDQWPEIIATLRQMELDLKRIPHTSVTAAPHEDLLRAVRYLHLCYEELAQGHQEEGLFYYNNALVQVTYVHQFLIDSGVVAS